MRKIFIDNRWNGTGGIGTFASEINRITQFQDAGFTGKPYSPLDSIKTSLHLANDSKKKIFFPGYIPPIYSKSPYVFTIHDLNHLDRGENSSFIKKIFYNTIIKRGCRNAKYVFTVSEFSRQRIIQWSGISADKVINVGNGVSNKFTPLGEAKDYGFDYILCVSNRKAHKNELRTIEAFKLADFKKKMRLVLTGKPDEETKNYIEKLGLENDVIFTGYVDEKDFPALYRGAKALVFVSLYEGFGLPVIEAMASGIPVVTSNTTSLIEVSGGAAITVNPESISEIKNALLSVTHDIDLRNKLIQSGIIQSKKYTWNNVAEKVKEYLNKFQ